MVGQQPNRTEIDFQGFYDEISDSFLKRSANGQKKVTAKTHGGRPGELIDYVNKLASV